MTDLSFILRETRENQIENIPLKINHQNENINSNKEIFFPNNELNKNLNDNQKIVIKIILNKENSMTNNKTKIINNNKQNIENILDFDKVLNILHNHKPKKKKLLSHKRLKKNKNLKSSNSESKIIYFIIFEIENNLKKRNKSTNRNINDIYNISNFCSNTYKIEEKSIPFNIKIPDFKELDNNFFEIDDLNEEVN